MIFLSDVSSVSSALGDPDLDLNLRALLGFRAWHMVVEHEASLGTDAVIIVVQGGDTPEVINNALGFPITGEQAEDPSFLSIEDFGLWYEVAYARDEGPHVRIFVENGPATELGLHYMCQSHFWPDGQEGAA